MSRYTCALYINRVRFFCLPRTNFLSLGSDVTSRECVSWIKDHLRSEGHFLEVPCWSSLDGTLSIFVYLEDSFAEHSSRLTVIFSQHFEGFIPLTSGFHHCCWEISFVYLLFLCGWSVFLLFECLCGLLGVFGGLWFHHMCLWIYFYLSCLVYIMLPVSEDSCFASILENS